MANDDVAKTAKDDQQLQKEDKLETNEADAPPATSEVAAAENASAIA